MTCPMCGGPLVVLGVLGITKHYRCRDCGMMVNVTVRRKHGPETTQEQQDGELPHSPGASRPGGRSRPGAAE